MGSGNRSGVVGGTEKSESESISEYYCDVGLGLKVQRTESFPNSKRMMVMPHLPHSHPHHHHHFPSSETIMTSTTVVGFPGSDSAAGVDGGPIYCNTSNNRFACVSDIYDVVSDSSLSAGAVVVPRTFHSFTSDFPFKSSGGSMPAPVEVPFTASFTASQWQELERQTMIYKYMMASVPVPPQLLIPITRTTSNIVPTTASQSNMSGLDLRFSSGSDPEPWRCRRTDGKKWRCSRDVAPDQKYCERHAHKSRPRSRKPVESQPHNTNTNTTTTTTTTNFNAQPLINLQPNATPTQAFQNPTFPFPSLLPAGSTYDQPRCPEWFMKRDTDRVSINMNQQWQQLMQSSSRVGLKRDNTDCNKEVSFYHPYYGEGKEPMNHNSYMNVGDGQTLQNQQLNELASFQGSTLGAERTHTHTTRHFIDAWSLAEREEINEISNKCSDSSSGKPPLSSLSLSMSGGNGIDEESEYAQMGHGMMMDSERETNGGFKSQWLNPVSWMNSPPGGPLGEALCLGIASTAKAGSNLPSPHGYSNSNSTTATGTSSKSSCEESGHGLHFIK